MQDAAEVRSVAMAARAGQPLVRRRQHNLPGKLRLRGQSNRRALRGARNVRGSPCKKLQNALWSDAAHYSAPRSMSKPDNSGFKE